jgi:L-seryl-tRNA(Ser) seleniumtransferase
MSKDLLRQLPSVDRLLAHDHTLSLIADFGRPLTLDALRDRLDDLRARIQNGLSTLPTDETIICDTQSLLSRWLLPTLRRVINATGVIIHTNLGRAPLSGAAIEAMAAAAGGYSTLEFDLESGKRGSRQVHAGDLIRRITGAEAAMVVNNNAAGVLLALTALTGPTSMYPGGRGVIISRGQLVEIGGGFRIPDVMAQSGARLVEVGTTNRTHLRDYVNAVKEDTVMFLRAHRSNFAIIGFTTEPPLPELVELAAQHGLLVADDLGSGALIDTTLYGLAPEPLVQESVAAGADVVMFSGDKLLGGPQAGILAGKTEVIQQLRQHPLARAIRADKLCLAGLSATLTHYLKGEALITIPVWQMISMEQDAIHQRAVHWADVLTQAGLACEVIGGESAVGGGSLPGETLPTSLLAINVESEDRAATRLRAHDPPVIVRREKGRLLIDPRTVLKRDEEALLAALKNGLGE